MFRLVLWIAGACVALLAALVLGRTLMDRADPAPVAPAAEEAAAPVAAVVPEAPPPPPVAAPQPTPDEVQVQEDAAATGMTTVEPEAEPARDPEPPPT